MAGFQRSPSVKLPPTRGATLLVFANDNGLPSKLACKMARALCEKRVDRLVLVYCVLSDASRQYALNRLQELADPEFAACTTLKVIVKDPDQSIVEALVGYGQSLKADLFVMGSDGLVPGAKPSIRVSTGQVMGSLSARLIEGLTNAALPLLVVKCNSSGPFLSAAVAPPSPSTPAPRLRCMLNLLPSSRHVMEWILDRINPEKDSMILTVTQAFEGPVAKPTAQRLISTFAVQAAVNDVTADRRLIREGSSKGLPQLVQAEHVDILAVHVPRGKGLTNNTLDLLYDAKTSLLLWPLDVGGESGRMSYEMEAPDAAAST